MRRVAAVAGMSIRQNLTNPLMVGFLVMAPVFLTFVLGEALRDVLPFQRPLGYLTVIIMTQTVAHGALVGFWGIQRQRHHHTLPRIMAAPLAAAELVGGAFAASFVTLSAFVVTALLSGSLFLGIDLGPNPGIFLGTMAVGCAFPAAYGTVLGVTVQNEQAARPILSLSIPLLILIGGGYTPIPASGALSTLSWLSPVRWVNLALMEHLLGDPAADGVYALALSPAVAALLLLVAVLALRKKWRSL